MFTLACIVTVVALSATAPGLPSAMALAVPTVSALPAAPIVALPTSGSARQAAQAEDNGRGRELPDAEQVYILLRDMGLEYERAELRTIVASEGGASVLVGLDAGTLVDVELTEATDGWTLRDIFYVAGNTDAYQSWTAPWRRRVADAERFLATSPLEPGQRRRAQELAALMWFEDEGEATRLWGLNPTTYRIMQTLKMFPALGGPMGGDPSRRQQP